MVTTSISSGKQRWQVQQQKKLKEIGVKDKDYGYKVTVTKTKYYSVKASDSELAEKRLMLHLDDEHDINWGNVDIDELDDDQRNDYDFVDRRNRYVKEITKKYVKEHDRMTKRHFYWGALGHEH